MFSVIEIAAALERIAEIRSDRPLDPAALPKLLYYAQGLALAETGRPLFRAAIPAVGFVQINSGRIRKWARKHLASRAGR